MLDHFQVATIIVCIVDMLDQLLEQAEGLLWQQVKASKAWNQSLHGASYQGEKAMRSSWVLRRFRMLIMSYNFVLEIVSGSSILWILL